MLGVMLLCIGVASIFLAYVTHDSYYFKGMDRVQGICFAIGILSAFGFAYYVVNFFMEF